MKKLNSLILSTIAATILVGCGGGGSSSSTTNGALSSSTTKGTFIDNIVSGVKYVNGSNTGYTDTNGQFPYTSGKVEFYLGGIKLGELSSMTSDNKVFIQDIVGLDRTNTTNAKVLKIASLLQTLDSDPSTDEIEIKQSDFDRFENVNDSLDNISVNTILSNNGFTPKSQSEIQKHLNNSQKQHRIVLDSTSPTVNSSIEDAQTNVSPNSVITLTFSESIPKKYLENKYFSLINSSSNSVIEKTIEMTDNTITITPKSNLSYSQSYEFTISSDIKDFAGNELSNSGSNTNIIITFTTQDEIDTSVPVINTSSNISVDENQIDVVSIDATDNSSSLTYSLSGSDSSLFNINTSTGDITFKTAPDYETKNSYSFIITVKDPSNNSSSKNITVNINDIFEPDTTYPIFTSSNTINVDENQITVLTLIATDNSEITYSLEGTDKDSFNINSSTGEVTFKVVPDYETKNSYSIIASATDSSKNKTSQNITININDIYEYVNEVPIARAGNDIKAYHTEDITFDASSSTDNSAIASYEWSLNNTVLSNQVSFIKSDLQVGTHSVSLKVTDDEAESSTDTISVTVFDDFTNILPMDEVGGIKSISSSTINGNTRVSLGAGSQLYFKITNNMQRDFTVSKFEITSSYNGVSSLRSSTTDTSLLSGSTLNFNESISLGYSLSTTQTANYWIGKYTLTDVNTGEVFNNSFTWNGTRY